MLILRSSADIFLLDEPTNNLDLQGLVLLEEFINSSQKGFFIVSHDRKLLNQFVDGVVEMNEQTNAVEIYRNCSYAEYLQERKMKEEHEQEAYQDYLDEKKRLEDTVRLKKQEAQNIQRGPKKPRDHDKFIIGFKKDRSKKITSQAAAIEKRAGQLAELEPPTQPLPLNLRFNLADRSGNIVFRLEDAQVNYPNFTLGPINLEILYGDRVAILGPNGEGKTTLLKLLLEKIKPDSGSSHIGTRVEIGWLPQETTFDYQERIIDYFLKEAPIDESNARRILARFGFPQEKVYAKIGKVSPGQRSRIILAILMARPINCLVLDEPSNHLDPQVLDRLEAAMKDFNGTLVMVSHDRYLIDQVGITKTYLVERGVISPLTDYHEYEKIIIS